MGFPACKYASALHWHSSSTFYIHRFANDMRGGGEYAIWVANALYEMGCNIARGICMDKGCIFYRGRSTRVTARDPRSHPYHR